MYSGALVVAVAITDARRKASDNVFVCRTFSCSALCLARTNCPYWDQSLVQIQQSVHFLLYVHQKTEVSGIASVRL